MQRGLLAWSSLCARISTEAVASGRRPPLSHPPPQNLGVAPTPPPQIRTQKHTSPDPPNLKLAYAALQCLHLGAGTVDEKMYQRQLKKNDIAASMMGGGGGSKQGGGKQAGGKFRCGGGWLKPPGIAWGNGKGGGQALPVALGHSLCAP